MNKIFVLNDLIIANYNIKQKIFKINLKRTTKERGKQRFIELVLNVATFYLLHRYFFYKYKVGNF